MRLKEPLIGFRLVTGHTPAHIVFLLGSYLAVDHHPEHFQATKEGNGIIDASGSSIYFNMQLARTAHIAAILMKIIQMWADHNGHKIFLGVLNSLKVIFIMCSVSYIQFNINNTEMSLWYSPGTSNMLGWLFLEVIGFYLFVISGSIYLGMISCCKVALDANQKKEKRKYDAIEYYKNDLDWFIYIFVFLGLNSTSIAFYNLVLKPRIFQNDQEVDPSPYNNELHLLYICCFVRIFQLVTMRNLYNKKRQINQISYFYWFSCIALYSYCLLFLLISKNQLRTQRTVVLMDILMFYLQFFQYIISTQSADRIFYKKKTSLSDEMIEKQIEEQIQLFQLKAKNELEQKENLEILNDIKLRLKQNLKDKLITQTDDSPKEGCLDSYLQLIKYKQDAQKKFDERDDCDKYDNSTVKLGGDIYSMAFALFLDPQFLEKETDQKGNLVAKEGYLADLKVSKEEIINVFIGAFMIICFQTTMLYAVTYYIYYEQKPAFSINPGKTFVIVIARFLSSLMMHLNNEIEIRQGLALAKYVVNHPFRFKNSRFIDKDGVERANICNILPPFFLAVCQAMMGIAVELITLVYLTGLTNLLSVVVQFVTFLSITKFDNMYSEAIYENKVLLAKDKLLQRHFFNHHILMKEDFDKEFHESKFEDELVKLENLQKEYELLKSSRSNDDSENEEEEEDDNLSVNIQNLQLEIKRKQNDSNQIFGFIDGKPFYLNPKRNSLALQIMGYFVKILRIFYISVLYYFMPFVFTLITFIYSFSRIQTDDILQNQFWPNSTMSQKNS